MDMSRFPAKWPEWADTREDDIFDDGYDYDDDVEEMIAEQEKENDPKPSSKRNAGVSRDQEVQP